MITHPAAARVECEQELGEGLCFSFLSVPPIDGQVPDDEAARAFAAQRGWGIDEHGRDLCPRHR